MLGGRRQRVCFPVFSPRSLRHAAVVIRGDCGVTGLPLAMKPVTPKRPYEWSASHAQTLRPPALISQRKCVSLASPRFYTAPEKSLNLSMVGYCTARSLVTLQGVYDSRAVCWLGLGVWSCEAAPMCPVSLAAVVMARTNYVTISEKSVMRALESSSILVNTSPSSSLETDFERAHPWPPGPGRK
ncbi:hypothetical protein Q8A73_008290 [Channa argus]|nr:hypothetical protein Q8A73_008290 [Channa argus]